MVVIDLKENENQLSPLDGALSGVFLPPKWMPLSLYVSPSVSLSALLTPNRDGIYREATCDVRRSAVPRSGSLF